MPDKKKKPTQMPNHVGLYHKIKNITKKKNEQIEFMRGYNNK